MIFQRLQRIVANLDSDVVDAFGFPTNVFSELLREYVHSDTERAVPLEGKRLEDVGSDDVDVSMIDGAITGEDVEDGRLAFERGEIAVILLCGGMATRFGSSVKALAEVIPSKRFIDIAIDRISALVHDCGAPTPVLIVTSAATHQAVADYVRNHWPCAYEQGTVKFVKQRVFPRIREDGSLLTDRSTPIFYPPGHGDVLTSIVEQRANRWLAERGVKRVITWGIDNPLAGPNFRITAAHIRSGKPLTVEVVRRHADERGGHVIRCNGRVEIIEDFRLNDANYKTQSSLLNTNSMIIDIDSL